MLNSHKAHTLHKEAYLFSILVIVAISSFIATAFASNKIYQHLQAIGWYYTSLITFIFPFLLTSHTLIRAIQLRQLRFDKPSETSFNQTDTNNEHSVLVNISPVKEETSDIENICTTLGQFDWTQITVPSVQDAKHAVNNTEKQRANDNKASLLYGEISEIGVTKLLNNLEANHPNIKHFYDLGMGSGKVVIQSFLQCNNLTKCVGIELAKSRYILAEDILKQLLEKGYSHRKFKCVEYKKGEYFKIVEVQNRQRILEIWNGSCFDYPNGITDAHIVIMAIEFLYNMRKEVIEMMCAAPMNCKFVTYQKISSFGEFDETILREIECSDRYETSWSKNVKFYLWERYSEDKN